MDLWRFAENYIKPGPGRMFMPVTSLSWEDNHARLRLTLHSRLHCFGVLASPGKVKILWSRIPGSKSPQHAIKCDPMWLFCSSTVCLSRPNDKITVLLRLQEPLSTSYSTNRLQRAIKTHEMWFFWFPFKRNKLNDSNFSLIALIVPFPTSIH